MKNKRFLFVVNVDWFFVSHRLPIAKRLVALGHEVHIATHVTDKRQQLEEAGLVVHEVSLDRGSINPFGLATYFSAVRKVLDLVQPDLVHLVTIKPVLLGGLAARLSGVPRVVVAVSGLGTSFLAGSTLSRLRLVLIKWLYRSALRQKRLKVIFQNENDRALLRANTDLRADDVEMIYGSGVSLDQYKPLPAGNDVPVVLFAARLLHEKGVGEFVEAVRLFKERSDPGVGAQFVIVGSPDLENPSSVTMKEIDDWVRDGLVDYWGYRSDMPEVLSKADLVVFPSYYGEGLPKILIEAAASGRAVITTDHPGCRDAIEDGRSGLLVPVRDSGALVDAMTTLVDDADRRERMGLEGRRLAERKFDIEHVILRHLEIYEGLF